MMNQVTALASRIMFVGAFVLAGVGVFEKVVNVFGFTVLRGEYNPWRFLEVATWLVLFVIALQLREIKHGLEQRPPG